MPSTTERDAARALARLVRRLERSAGDLSLAHYRVLALIADGDQRASRVAERLALGRPAISAAIESLSDRGLVERRSVADDLRGASLRLTPAGRTALDAAEDQIVSELHEIAARTAHPARVFEALAALGPALDAAADERLAARLTTRQR